MCFDFIFSLEQGESKISKFKVTKEKWANKLWHKHEKNPSQYVDLAQCQSIDPKVLTKLLPSPTLTYSIIKTICLIRFFSYNNESVPLHRFIYTTLYY